MAQEKAMNKPLVGLLVVAVFALIATALAGTDFCQGLKLSSMVVGVLLGMVLANTARPYFPEGWGGGLAIAAKQFLRTGIVFYGFRLTLTSLLGVGLEAVLVDIIIVLGTLILGNVLGRVLGLEREERMLIASGSAICGAAAVLATEPVLKAKAHNTVVAVATVVLFGTLSMLLYPVLYRSGLLSFLSDKAVGVYTGSTVHEVAHVVGAGAGMTAPIAEVATITKMIRVIMLAPVLFGLSMWIGRAGKMQTATTATRIQVPWFAFYFIGVIFLNTLLTSLASSYGLSDVYHRLVKGIETLDTFVLTMAMTAIGLEATFAKFKQSGIKPFLLALGLYVWLVFGGGFLVKLLVG